MTYRMFSGQIPKGKNALDIINDSLEEQGEKRAALKLNFVGFEAEAGTEFYLNGHKEVLKVPTCGHFISPYNGAYYMRIDSLVFEEDFDGDIYYIY